MPQPHGLLHLLEQRVQLQEDLKSSLSKQQSLLVNNQMTEINEVVGEQLAILETIQEYENAWQQLLLSKFSPEEMAMRPLPVTERFSLSETESMQAKRLQDQLKTILKDVAELRETNRLLMNRSLSFIRGLFRSIVDTADSGAVYRKDQKSKAANVLIDRTL